MSCAIGSPTRLREALLRLAGQHGVNVETIHDDGICLEVPEEFYAVPELVEKIDCLMERWAGEVEAHCR